MDSLSNSPNGDYVGHYTKRYPTLQGTNSFMQNGSMQNRHVSDTNSSDISLRIKNEDLEENARTLHCCASAKLRCVLAFVIVLCVLVVSAVIAVTVIGKEELLKAIEVPWATSPSQISTTSTTTTTTTTTSSSTTTTTPTISFHPTTGGKDPPVGKTTLQYGKTRSEPGFTQIITTHVSTSVLPPVATTSVNASVALLDWDWQNSLTDRWSQNYQRTVELFCQQINDYFTSGELQWYYISCAVDEFENNTANGGGVTVKFSLEFEGTENESTLPDIVGNALQVFSTITEAILETKIIVLAVGGVELPEHPTTSPGERLPTTDEYLLSWSTGAVFEETTYPPKPYCLDHEERCPSGECIPKWHLCNNVDNCGDWSDEINCTCSDGDVKCPLGPCIPATYLCNYANDCGVNWDERNCACAFGELACRGGGCIPEEWRCDSVRDCFHGDDEDECLGTNCSPDSFICRDYSCVPGYRHCDGIEDCSDGSDEHECVRLNEHNVLEVYSHRASNYFPVCSNNWLTEWNAFICEELGLGRPMTSFEVATSTDIKNTFLVTLDIPTLSSIYHVLRGPEATFCASTVSLICSSKDCGTRASFVDQGSVPALIHAWSAAPGRWPRHVAIEYDGLYNCGGALLNNRWVLTAAHCVDLHTTITADDFTIRIGTTKRTNHDINSVTMKIEAYYTYFHWRSNFLHDLALIKLKEVVVFTDFIRPVCLPDRAESFQNTVECYTTGWGSTSRDNMPLPSEDLLEVKMTMISDDLCRQIMESHGDYFFNADNMLCTGTISKTTSVCKGDSGGPLVCSDQNGIWSLAGIISFSITTKVDRIRRLHCNDASGFTQVTAYSGWVVRTMAENS